MYIYYRLPWCTIINMHQTNFLGNNSFILSSHSCSCSLINSKQQYVKKSSVSKRTAFLVSFMPMIISFLFFCSPVNFHTHSYPHFFFLEKSTTYRILCLSSFTTKIHKNHFSRSFLCCFAWHIWLKEVYINKTSKC